MICRFLLTSILLTLGLEGVAASQQRLTQQQAFQVASRFPQLRETASRLSPSTSLPAEAARGLYAFNVGQHEGFVIVGQHPTVGPEVIAYSHDGHLDAEAMPEGLRYWLHLTAASMQHEAVAEAPQPSAWRTLQLPAEVAPLLGQMAWGQGYPFNELCPTSATGAHYYTGCVATAATQIMRYHEWPQSYDWSLMPLAPSQTSAPAGQVQALSALAADFGAAVQMEYAAEGSGASSMLVPGALRQVFGYPSDIRVHRRNFYSTGQWLELICSELAAGRPVYYGASSDSGLGGHAFVCDGYDADGYMHINWGWYGQSNGYFSLNHLNPSSLGIGGGTGGYNTDQEVVTGISAEPVADLMQEWPAYGAVRLSVSDYVTEATLMTILENYDTEPLSAQIGAVAMRHDTLLAVLRQEPLQVAGFSGNLAGYSTIWMRNVPLSSIDAADGPCQVRLALLPQGAESWQPLRHLVGTTGYADALITDHRLQLIGAHEPQPEVLLLEPLVPTGPAYVQGVLSLHTRIRTLAPDFRLRHVVVRLTSLLDGSQYDLPQAVNVYDQSDEELSLLVSLPAQIAEGDYEVTLCEQGYESCPFDDSQVGRLRLTLLPDPGHPMLQLTQQPVWTTTTGGDVICQGDNLNIACEVRNYGPAGTAAMQCWLTDVSDPSRSYIYQQRDVDTQSGQTAVTSFYRRLAVDPGLYRLDFSYLMSDGELLPEPTTFATPTLSVGPDTLRTWLEAVSLEMPDTLYLKERVPCTFRLKALQQDFSGTIYLRLRQYTNTNGELAYMGTQRISAGQTADVSFNYRPGVTAGQYMLLAECKQGGVEGTIAGYPVCYRTITILEEHTHIEAVAPDADAPHRLFDLWGRPIRHPLPGQLYLKR